MLNTFVVGDIIQGLPNNGYGYTNEDMTKARVIHIRPGTINMVIEVFDHMYPEIIGRTYDVDNDTDKFKLIKYTSALPKNIFETGDKIAGKTSVHNNERPITGIHMHEAIVLGLLANNNMTIEITKHDVIQHINAIISVPNDSDLYILL
jgi:hypothetical protein